MNSANNSQKRLVALVDHLRDLPAETEWLEFKHDNSDAERIGRTASGISNAARLADQSLGYMAWGVRNSDHAVVGTTFEPSTAQRSGQPLIFWLSKTVRPDLELQFHVVEHPQGRVVLLFIPAALAVPTKFENIAYLRIGEATPKLADYPQREAALLAKLRPFAWESGIAANFVISEQVLDLIDAASYFRFTEQTPPSDTALILERLEQDKLIASDVGGRWDVLNLGALLFGKRLDAFGPLARKAVRVVEYGGEGRTKTIREQTGNRGYAAGFSGLLEWLESHLPGAERITAGRRERKSAYPTVAVRELVANALIHQDLTISGAGPMIEIFTDRVEITNPGKPLIAPFRFLDLPPRSRNESLASLMRRMKICEERGSGVDKVIAETEEARLPPPDFLAPEDNTLAILYGPRTFAQMGTAHRVRACYWHAALKYVQGEGMTNSSLRDRFGVDDNKSSQVSRIIQQAVESGYIKPCPDWNPRTGYYWPAWAFS